MQYWQIILASAGALVCAFALSATVRKLAGTLVSFGQRMAMGSLCLVSHGLDAVLRPNARDGAVPPSRHALYLALHAAAASCALSLTEHNHAVAGIAVSASTLVVLVALTWASLFKIREERAYLKLFLRQQQPCFRPEAAVRQRSVIITNSALAFLHASLCLALVERAFSGLIMFRMPATGIQFFDAVLCIASAIPGFYQLVTYTELRDVIEFGSTWGKVVWWGVSTSSLSVFLTGYLAAVTHERDIAHLLHAFETAKGEDAHTIQVIASRAPPIVKRRLLEMAINSRAGVAQTRAIAVMRHMRVFTFPQTFLHHLAQFTPAVRHRGLDQIASFLSHHGAEFDVDFLNIGYRKAVDALGLISKGAEFDRETAETLRAILRRYEALLANRGAVISLSPHRKRILDRTRR